MKWNNIVEAMNTNIVDIAKNSILDMIVPLQNEGVQSLGVNQVIASLRNNPDMDGINIDNNLIQNAIDGVDGLSLSTDASGDLNLNIGTTSDVSPQTEISTSSEKRVNDAAVRAAKKDF